MNVSPVPEYEFLDVNLGDWLDRVGTVAHTEELFGEALRGPESASEQS
ncbi:hypothetical protein [Streptomyces sp. NPDC002580]